MFTSHLAARLDGARGRGGADQLGGAVGERQVHQALVAQQLDAPNRRAQRRSGGGSAVAQVQMLGADTERGRALGRRPGAERGARHEVDPRRAEARRDRTGLRVFVDLARAADLGQVAVVEHADPRRQGQRLGLVVGDVEHGRAQVLLDPLQLQAQVVAQLGVERGQWLVHQGHGRLAHQRPADCHSLHLPAGKARRRVGELVLDAQQAGDLGHLLAHPGLGNPAQRRAQGKGEVVEDAQVRIERVLLEHEGDVAQRRRGGADVLAADEDPTLVRPLEAGDEAQRRRLAGTARPEQDDELARGDVEREIVHGRGRAEAFSHAIEAKLSHGSPRVCRAKARPVGLSNSETVRASKARPTRSPRSARTCGPTLARRVEPTAVVTVTIWLWPRYSLPSTSPRSPEASSKRTCSGRTPQSSSPPGAGSARSGT
jgi:hypothetical protein